VSVDKGYIGGSARRFKSEAAGEQREQRSERCRRTPADRSAQRSLIDVAGQ
jgi:hypothetical protein